AVVDEVLSLARDVDPKRIPRSQIFRQRGGGPSVLSWNINGLRGFLKSPANVHSITRLIDHERPTIIVLSETKLTEEKRDAALSRLLESLPVRYDVYSTESLGRKGYAGVAVLIKRELCSQFRSTPLAGIPPRFFEGGYDEEEATTRGRVLALTLEQFTLVAVYVPNSGGDLRFLPYREKWDVAFREYLKELRAANGSKPFIVVGDLNVCSDTLDIGDLRREPPHSPSIQPCEMTAFRRLCDEVGLQDSFRLVHPLNEGIYSFYCNSREKKLNYGRRLDYILISEDMRAQVVDSYVFYAEFGLGYRPDHCPTLLELSTSFFGSEDIGIQCDLPCGNNYSCEVEGERLVHFDEDQQEVRQSRARLMRELAETLRHSTFPASVSLDLLAPLLFTGDDDFQEDVNHSGVGNIVTQLVGSMETTDTALRTLPRLDDDFMWEIPTSKRKVRDLPSYQPKKPRPGPAPPVVKDWLLSHLNLEDTCLTDKPVERQRLEKLVLDHWDVFDYEGRNLPEMTGVFHEIHLVEGAQPVYCAPYRMSPEQKQALEAHVKDLLSQNLIEPSQSEWQSPVMFIAKKGGGWRVVQDFRRLNKLTEIPRYPLPLVAQVLDELSTSKIYSAFDARSGFWQVPLAPSSRYLTAFGTHIGQFQWRRMPMGLAGSPPTYQSSMNRSYAPILYRCCILYLDDAVLYTLLISGHFEALELFFCLTRDANITLTARKMQLFRTSLKYVGMHISGEGVRMDDTKVKAITELPLSSKSPLKDIRSFLGSTNYFRKWIKDYSRLTAPLRRVLKKDEHGWDDDCDESVVKLKKLLTSDPLLVWPDFTRSFELHTDASEDGYGAILVQRDDGDRERVVAYGSRAVGDTEKAWTAQEKECYAAVIFAEEFRPYLQDRPFKLVTDASNLRWLLTTEHTTQRLMRWAIRLSAFSIVAQVLDELSTSKIYSAFDARSGFWQVPLAPSSRYLTAFGTHIGQFQWRRMPMGLAGSPPTYQSSMNRSYAPILYRCCILYLDDAVLYTLLISGHFEALELFFCLTRDANITLTARKMQLFRTSLKYVGMHISGEGVRMDDTKVKAITELPLSSKSPLKDIRSFLGSTNYFRKWIKDYSRLTAPLRRVLKKDEHGWDDDCDESVVKLKKLLTSDPLLVWPDFTRSFELHTDASEDGYGAILVQRDDGDRERVVAYGSRAVGDTEKAWTAQEKECYAAVIFAEEFRPYLQDRPFKLVTDASNLRWLLTTEHTTQRLMRWAIRLSAFSIEIVHREGRLNAVADMLSRNPVDVSTGAVEGDAECTTPNVIEYLEALYDRDVELLLVCGPPGTGKSMLACKAAAEALMTGKIQKVVVTRPVTPTGRDIGFVKGSVAEKMNLWVRPVISYLSRFLPEGKVREFQAEGVIEVIPISMIRGFSFENTWLIVDEAQNCSFTELWAILTRIGTGSRLLVIGDMSQCDLQGKSGFDDVVSKISTLEGEERKHVRLVELTAADCKRSPVVKLLLRLRDGPSVPPETPSKGDVGHLLYADLETALAADIRGWVGHTCGLVSVVKGQLGFSPETWDMRRTVRRLLGSTAVSTVLAGTTFDAIRIERERVCFIKQYGVVNMEVATAAWDMGFPLSTSVDVSSSSFLPGLVPELVEWVGPTLIEEFEASLLITDRVTPLVCAPVNNDARAVAEASVNHKVVNRPLSPLSGRGTRRQAAYSNPCEKYGCTRAAIPSSRYCNFCTDLCDNDICRRPRATGSRYCTVCKRSFDESEGDTEGLEVAADEGQDGDEERGVTEDLQRSLDALLVSDLRRNNPSSETLRHVKKLQEEDPEIAPLIKFLNGDSSGLSKESALRVRAKAERHYMDQLLRRTQYDESLDTILHQVVVPKPLRAALLDLYHTGVETGHPGRYGMYNLLRRQFYWKGMWRDCSEFVRHCLTCRSISHGPTTYGNVQQHSRHVSFSMQRVAVDLVGPIYLPEPVRDGDYPVYCLVMLDVYTGWLELAPLYTKEAKEVAQAVVDHWILRHGPFCELLSDRGTEFLNDAPDQWRHGEDE
ncbi:DNA-(apurinic or apyrimidinic site) lyase, partial [Perkinsus chesapeaki]